MSEYQEYLRQVVAGLQPLQKVMLALDVALTGHEPTEVVRQYHHYPVNLEHWIKRDGFQFIWYLSDSGYSRVVWNEESGNLFLTDNSRQQVKDNWEAAAPQRQAVADELRRQWDALAGPQQEAEDPKRMLRGLSQRKRLPAGEDYTLYIKIPERNFSEYTHVKVYKNGATDFFEPFYNLGFLMDKVLPTLGIDPDEEVPMGMSATEIESWRATLKKFPGGEDEDDDLLTERFYVEVGKYTGPIQEAISVGFTHGKVEGILGTMFWRIEHDFKDLGSAKFEALCLVDNILNESPDLKTLKARRRSLDSAEKREAGDAPVWKADVNGRTWYVVNTHRCYQAKPTVKAAAHAWHHGVEQSG